MADQKISDLTLDTTPSLTDLLETLKDPAGTPLSRRITLTTLVSTIMASVAGLVLLESHTASGSAALNFTTRNAPGQSGATFQSDYDEYELELVQLIPATNNVSIAMQYSTDGGSSYDTGGNYAWAGFFVVNNANANQGSESGTAFVFGQSVHNGVGMAGTFKLFDPLTIGDNRHYLGLQTGYSVSNGRQSSQTFGGRWLNGVSAANACRIAASSGALTSGSARLYGRRK